MANGTTYGINFPFRDSVFGDYFDLSETNNEEVRSNLIHLLLTRKGTRYFLPNFGTRLYEYIFEPMDGPTFSEIQAEIRESVQDFIPNLTITNISVTDASVGQENKGEYVTEDDTKVFRVSNISQLEHTAKIRIDYTISDDVFDQSDFVIINI
jgi:phage baseplate assembly protein W